MIRNPLFRRFVVTTVMLLGLFSQFQTVFACEIKDGKIQFVCCCDEAGGMSMGCAMGGGCQDQTGPVSSASNCCEVSYQKVPGATAVTSASHTQQVLLLDAPQPPPLLTSFDLQIIPALSQAVRFTTDIPPLVAGTQTYLLTNRFRI